MFVKSAGTIRPEPVHGFRRGSPPGKPGAVSDMLEPSCEGQSHPCNLHHVRFFVLSTGSVQFFVSTLWYPRMLSALTINQVLNFFPSREQIFFLEKGVFQTQRVLHTSCGGECRKKVAGHILCQVRNGRRCKKGPRFNNFAQHYDFVSSWTCSIVLIYSSS